LSSKTLLKVEGLFNSSSAFFFRSSFAFLILFFLLTSFFNFSSWIRFLAFSIKGFISSGIDVDVAVSFKSFIKYGWFRNIGPAFPLLFSL